MDSITLNIKKEFLEAILSGYKKVEYRAGTDSLINKLKKVDSAPFQLRLINGMTKQAPEATVLVHKLLQDVNSAVFEFHIDSVLSTKYCDSLSTFEGVEETESDVPVFEVSSDSFRDLKSSQSDSFLIENDEESFALTEELSQSLPMWIKIQNGQKQIDKVLYQILQDVFNDKFELRVLNKPSA